MRRLPVACAGTRNAALRAKSERAGERIQAHVQPPPLLLAPSNVEGRAGSGPVGSSAGSNDGDRAREGGRCLTREEEEDVEIKDDDDDDDDEDGDDGRQMKYRGARGRAADRAKCLRLGGGRCPAAEISRGWRIAI